MRELLLPAPLAAALLAAGCTAPPDGVGCRLFDAAGGTTFRNHVRAVPDPAGSGRQVLQGERISKTSHHLVFVNKKGFFTVPEGHRGAVVVRLLVRRERRVRIALVAGGKLRSYYLQVPQEGEWCDLVLPLERLKGRIAAGQVVDDISIWLLGEELPGGKPGKLRKGSEIYLDRAELRVP